MPITTEECLLCDTNVLARFVNIHDRKHLIIVQAASLLQNAGLLLLYAPQSLREFWNLATRPKLVNGFELPVWEADHLARQIESAFTLLHDTEAMHTKWRRLVVQHEVKGVQVHDARLAASALVGGCKAILTLNDTDFRRYGVPALHPLDVPAFLGT